MHSSSIWLVTLLVCAGEPAYAQSTPQPDTTSPSKDLQAQQPVSFARRQPNSQPSAPTQTIGNFSSTPNWLGSVTAAPGHAVAGGVFYSAVTEGAFYDDNVFASHSNRLSDLAFFTRPEFAWVKQGQNYSVGVDGSIEGRKYLQFDSEDQINGSLGANFTFMPNSDSQVVGTARYIHSHLDRGTSETIGPGGLLLSTTFNSPVAYDEGLGSIALNHRYDRWWTSVGFAGLGINYQNASIPGAIVDFGYADGTISVANGRVGYVVMPQTSVFVEAAGNSRDWGVNVFDSTGYRLVGGMLFEQGGNSRLKGEIWAGYMNQQYSGVSFQNVSNWTYGAGLSFLFTDQLTGVVEGKREAKEAALSLAEIAPGVVGASADSCSISPGAACVSAIETSIGGRLEYRILPNLAVGAGATYLLDDYLGPVAGNRSDRTLSPLASIKYFPTDRVTLGFDYRRVNFDPVGGQAAGVAAVSYFRNVYLVSATEKF